MYFLETCQWISRSTRYTRQKSNKKCFFSAEGDRALTIDYRDNILLWEFCGEKKYTVLERPAGALISLSFAGGGRWLFAVIACPNGDRIVVLWDLRLSKPKYYQLNSPSFPHSKDLSLVSINDDGRYGITGADVDRERRSTAILWDFSPSDDLTTKAFFECIGVTLI